MITRSKNGISKPKALISTKHPLPPQDIEPTCFTTANKDPKWRNAMVEEINALLKNKTWSLVPPRSHQNIVGCKWVFRIKRKADGTIERYKARLVAKGFHQREGIDFQETFSPVIKPCTIRLVLSLAISNGWHIHQLDVQNAFLHETLNEEVYMQQPPGFVDPNAPNYVCRLHKSLYGLKQAPRAWYNKLRTFLIQYGFYGAKSDTSLFIKTSSSSILYLLVYVDDIILTGSSIVLIQQMVQALHQAFSIKDLGSLNYFLGIEATRGPHGLFLSQQRYILDLLLKTKMDQAKPCPTPMVSNLKLSKNVGDPFQDVTLYRSTVGALQYLTFTRPDISFSVNKVC